MPKPGTITTVAVQCHHCGCHCDPANKVQVGNLLTHSCESHPLSESLEGVLLWSDEVTTSDVLPGVEFVWGPVDW